MMMIWAHPEWLHALWAIPLLGGVWLWHELWVIRALNKLGEPQLRSNLMQNRSIWRRLARNGAAILALTCGIIALANPQKSLGEVEIETSGIDIIFAMDMSRSMLAKDVKPSRLDVAKQIVKNTIEKSAGDRFGIIAFSSSAYPQLPITTDVAAAEMTLTDMDPDYLPSSGSDVSSAIVLGTKKFDPELPQDKALIILSDGEDHQGEWETAVANAVDSGVFVFTIGLGTEEGGPIPTKTYGEYHRDNSGEVVISKRNSGVLRSIADAGNGRYFDGNRLRVADEILSSLDELQKAQMGVKKQSQMEDQFQFPLGLGLLLLLARTLLGERSSDTLKKWLKNA